MAKKYAIIDEMYRFRWRSLVMLMVIKFDDEQTRRIYLLQPKPTGLGID